ncbi:MAG: hypothetical protein H6733_02540 [Alphaproteobacteria bacterium]|nr:hypothetical protein [Alphaproteobacteria bacterium]
MRRSLAGVALLAACTPGAQDGALSIAGYDVHLDAATGALSVDGPHGPVLVDATLALGSGTQVIEQSVGAYRFSEVTNDLVSVTGFGPVDAEADPITVALRHDDVVLGHLTLAPGAGDSLRLEVTAAGPTPDTPRLRLTGTCDADEHMLGLGSHAMDVDHVGEAFALWVSEPGIGKTTSDVPESNWTLVGTKHASSYPVPFLLRPQRPAGVLIDTDARVEVDLCATDTARWSTTAWDDDVGVSLFSAATALDVVRDLSDVTGRPRRLPRWALAPWNDAIRGAARVETVATEVRTAGAPSSVIWSEDWKGAAPNLTGYRLSEAWSIDRTLYPDTEAFLADLTARGFAWFGYFAPFVGLTADVGDALIAADAAIRDPDGAPYSFTGVNFKPTTMPDLSTDTGRAWCTERMQAAVDLGLRGWMADFAEWLPTDAVLADGSVGLDVHNAYPRWWQETNAAVLDPVDGVAFCRSGWAHTAGTCPVVWLGDQRTDFQPDDGLPTILPLALGLSASGVPVVTHDVAGYQSATNPPSTPELWDRWAWLGAFSPILRTHHGSSDTANHQFDTDADTLALWTAAARAHMALFPYRDALNAAAATDGTPMVLPLAMVFPDEDWTRIDAWMLGTSLLVAPVVTQGATSRAVDLPAGVTWYDWWTGDVATGGTVDAPLGTIPVFAAGGTTVPLFDTVPDTLLDGTTAEGVRTFEDADVTRQVRLYGGGGPFTEADGTTYAVTGTATSRQTVTATLSRGTVAVGGVTLRIDGDVARTYTVTVFP